MEWESGFLAIEGGEGAGKSTFVKDLVARLSETAEVVVTREPGGTALAEQIRELILSGPCALSAEAEMWLFAAARRDHVNQIIRPALEAGKVVICDRFVGSTWAYSGAQGHLSDAVIQAACEWGSDGLIPEKTIYLDVTVEQGLARAGKRAALDAIESRPIKFHERVRDRYLARAYADASWIKVDASGTPQDTFERFLKAISESQA